MGKLGRTAAREFRKVLPPTLLFFFLFHMVWLTRAAVLGRMDLDALRATSATVGALLVGKAVLVAEELPFGRWFADRAVLRVLWKTLLFGAVTLLFRILEEALHLLSAHEGFGAAFRAVFRDISWPLVIVVSLWVLGGLLLYVAAVEVVRAVGAERVREALLGRRAG